MREGKAALTNRLRKEGLWGEASAYMDEMRRKYREEGMRRAESNEAAWAALSVASRTHGLHRSFPLTMKIWRMPSFPMRRAC